jgi:putative ABC transport system substrate-binding protein
MIFDFRLWILDWGGCRRIARGLCALALTLAILAAPLMAEAQQPVPRIGYMHAGSRLDATYEAFQQGLRDLGYLEGKNIVLEYRYAEGKVDRLPGLAAELVRIKVDIIVASTEPGARAAKNATKTIPIVMVGVGAGPVEAGLVESLARPGGNISGLTSLGVELAGKRLELLKETVPKVARVAILYDPANRANLLQVKEIQAAARPLGLTVQSWEVRGAADFERVFTAVSKERPDGLYVPGGPLMFANEKRIVDFALKSRLPSVSPRREVVDAGGLMSYGVDPVDHYRRAATYVDKILKGAKPADLPVEQPTKFELVINLKTAKALGLTVPQLLLLRADQLIQ